MRRSSSVRNILPLAVAILLCAPDPRLSGDKSPKHAKPEVLRVTVYPSGLSAGGASIDLRNGMMECFTRNARILEPRRKANRDPIGDADCPSDVYRVFARLSKRESAELKSLVVNSGLHDFVWLNDHLRCRRPARDVCPPTLVIVWSDRTQVFKLPLTGSVRKGIPAASRRAYQSTAGICRRVCALQEAYARGPYTSGPTAPQYGRFGNGTGQGW